MSVPAYDFLSPRRIVFGRGRRNELGKLAATLGRRAWIICGSRTLEHSGTLDALRENLAEAGVTAEHLVTIRREPEVTDVDQAVSVLRQAAGSSLQATSASRGVLVIAVGGGAAIDLAKAVAALAPQAEPGSVLEYLEGVGTGRTIDA